MHTSTSTPELISARADLEVLLQNVVDATVQLHEDMDAALAVRTRRMVRQRQALRDLCVASGAWTKARESAYRADIAALRKLGGLDRIPSWGVG